MSEEQPQNSKPSAPGRPFQKGKSGNPGGRPKSIAVVRELAQKHCPDAIKKLVSLMQNAENEGVQKAAADSLLDRGYGKPAQAITGADGGAVLLDFSVDLTRAAEGVDAE